MGLSPGAASRTLLSILLQAVRLPGFTLILA